ncbi:MAG: conjugal transfer protein TraC [Steroidobacteraceae bacterium]
MCDPLHPEANYRSPGYSIAGADTRCTHCGRTTRVLALLLPEDHEALDTETADDMHAWRRAGANAFLFYLAHMPHCVQRRLLQLSRTFRVARSEATLNAYWANHCEHCGLLLSDHELHCEPDGAFMPCSEAEARNILLLQIDEPFEAVAAGCALEPAFFQFMLKA